MTDEQINAVIAEACPDKFRNENGVWFFQYAKDCWSQCHNNNICADLNAMHEAEETLSGTDMFVMGINIERLVSRHGQHYFHATARQRAEAFLRTLGLWKEVQE